MHNIRLDYVLLRSVGTLFVVLAVTLSSWWPEASVSSAAEMPVGATLKVLALPVEVQPALTETFVAGMDGQMLNQGDVVRTGPGGLALLTFFDGSESQLGAETQVQIERAEATPAPQIALLQTAGVTMNHVVPMPPGGSFQTDTPAATGLVRGTSYVVVVGEGASQSSDEGSASQTVFTCGQTGDRSCATSVILLTDRDGHVGRVDVAAPGSSAAAPIQLSKAGDAASSDAGQTAPARLSQPHLEALEAGANARELPEAARDAEYHAHVVAVALARLTAPVTDKSSDNVDIRDALEPAAPVKSTDEPAARPDDVSRAIQFHVPAAPVSVPAVASVPAAVVRSASVPAAVVPPGAGAAGDNQQFGQTSSSVAAPPPPAPQPAAQPVPASAAPAAPVSRPAPAPPAVSVPPVSVPAPSAANQNQNQQGNNVDPAPLHKPQNP